MTIHNNFSAHQNVTGRQMMGRRMTMSPKWERACRGFNCSPLLCRESNLGSSSLLAPGSRTGRQGFVFAPHTYIWSPDSGQWTHNDRTRSGAGPEVESGLVVLEKDTDRTDPSFKHTNHLQTQLDANRTGSGQDKILTSKHAISPTLPHDRKRHSHRQSLLVCVFVCLAWLVSY